MRFHDPQAYRKMDVTMERISCILELREILPSIQPGFNLVSAAVACAILESISGFEPSSVWIDKSISLSSKIQLMRSLVTSIFLYACESWNLTAELQRRIQAMEMRCYRKILRISYKDHVPRSSRQCEQNGNILTIVKRRKLQWYCHVSSLSGLAKIISQGTVKGGRRQGRQKKR